jgi:hypothetical protein
MIQIGDALLSIGSPKGPQVVRVYVYMYVCIYGYIYVNDSNRWCANDHSTSKRPTNGTHVCMYGYMYVYDSNRRKSESPQAVCVYVCACASMVICMYIRNSGMCACQYIRIRFTYVILQCQLHMCIITARIYIYVYTHTHASLYISTHPHTQMIWYVDLWQAIPPPPCLE